MIACVDGWGLMTVDLWIGSPPPPPPPSAQEMVLMVMHRPVSSYTGTPSSPLELLLPNNFIALHTNNKKKIMHYTQETDAVHFE